jgi:hypothetical protein
MTTTGTFGSMSPRAATTSSPDMSGNLRSVSTASNRPCPNASTPALPVATASQRCPARERLFDREWRNDSSSSISRTFKGFVEPLGRLRAW